MQQSLLESLIPAAKLDVAEKALQATFNTKIVDSVELLTGGFSPARVYRIGVQGKSYVLRLAMHVDGFNDPIQQYTCMNIAAEAGVAPHVYYANAEDALAIIEYIEPRSPFEHFSNRDDMLIELAKTVKSLHATSAFPGLINYLDRIDQFIQRFQASTLLPKEATEECFAHYAEIQKVYPRYDTAIVSSHNELNPNNILFDGTKFWLIDWETAFQNDQYVDLANIANFMFTNETNEDAYLRAYFGETLDNHKRARFFLMRQVCHLLYAMLMLNAAISTKPIGWQFDPTVATPSRLEFYERLKSGNLSLASFEGQILFGQVQLNAALVHMKTPRFAESIALMSGND